MRCLRLAVLGACLLLTGCFLSKEPLITPETADHPVRIEARFTQTFLCNFPERERPAGCVGQTDDLTLWSGTLRNQDGWYLFDYDDHPGLARARLLLKSIGGNLYIAQADMHFDATPLVIKTLKGQRYAYDLVRIEANSAYGFSFGCEVETDRRWVVSKQLAAIDRKDCIAGSLEGLVTIFRARLAAGAKPKVRIDFKLAE